jgi:hypothetical protein
MQPPDDAEQRLVRLLAFKRHETPPPGFFDQLPVRILVNLRAGSEVSEIPWWTRAWRVLVHEPMIGLSYAALGMGAVLFGISVLETAVDVQNPPNSPTQGLFPGVSSDVVLSDPQGIPPGMVYRIVEPSPATWFQTGLNPQSQTPGFTPFSRVGSVDWIQVGVASPR